MPIIKLTLDEEHYKKLLELANNVNKSPQEYIKDLVFNEKSIFVPEEAVRRAHEKFPNGVSFSIPDLYSEEEWSTIGRGTAGVFGKRFYRYITSNKEAKINFVDMGKYGRRAEYKVNGVISNE